MATATPADALTELHGKMMAKAEELWSRAEAAGESGEEEQAEQWEACAMVAEECAALVAAAKDHA